MRAATAATCGADADVPKKLGRPLPSEAGPGEKKVVSAPSGPTTPGWSRVTGEPRRLPAVSKQMAVPPADENDSSTAGLTPKPGVFVYRAAPTPIAPAALAWPTSVLLLVAKVLTEA